MSVSTDLEERRWAGFFSCAHSPLMVRAAPSAAPPSILRKRARGGPLTGVPLGLGPKPRQSLNSGRGGGGACNGPCVYSSLASFETGFKEATEAHTEYIRTKSTQETPGGSEWQAERNSWSFGNVHAGSASSTQHQEWAESPNFFFLATERQKPNPRPGTDSEVTQPAPLGL